MWNKVTLFFGLGVVALLLVAATTAVSADETKSLKDVVSEIRQAQGLKADQSIDCDKVTDSQYLAVGEAWMDVMVPDPQRHAMMDRMMGGPGSKSLARAHEMMGARYLGCISEDEYGGMMMPGMMALTGGLGGFGSHGGYGGAAGYMMGYGSSPGGYYGGPMGGGYGGYGGWMHSWGGDIVMWIILLAVIGLIVYLIVGAGHHRHETPPGSHSESAHDILKKRYARGEISKEDFERMKKDIG